MLLRDILLTEDRKPNGKYIETRTKGALSRVTLALEGNDSGAATRLATRYMRLDKSAKLLKEKRDELNAHVKDFGDAVFAAEDAVATRVIQTISYTMTLSAAEKAEDKEPTKKIDYEAAFNDLSKLVPELTAKIDEIRVKYTELVKAKDTPTKLTVKKNVSEGLVAGAKALWNKFMTAFREWTVGYDERLRSLKKKYR